MYVTQNKINYHAIKMIDTSQLTFIKSPELDLYAVSRDFYQSQNNDNNLYPVYVMQLSQSNKNEVTTWSIVTLDVTLGLVGGIMGIFWASFGFMISPYE